MSWQDLVGHEQVVERFRRALARGRLSGSFLFVGPEGVGKRTFALKLAQVLLCAERDPAQFSACARCASCVQVAAGTHPDLLQVAKPEDRAFLPLELVVGDKEHRGQAGLCHDLALRPYMGGYRVAVIDDADYFNQESANALLKTLEEPPPRAVLILIGTSAARQLPTIRSRCQLVRFQPLSVEQVAELLLAHEIVTEPEKARQLAALSGGSLQRARELADPALWEFRSVLFGHLAAERLDVTRLAAEIGALLGKRPPGALRRARAREVIRLAVAFYRELLRLASGLRLRSGPETATDWERWLGQAAAHVGPEQAAAALERCIEALGQVDRNALESTVVEGWLDDLARL